MQSVRAVAPLLRHSDKLGCQQLRGASHRAPRVWSQRQTHKSCHCGESMTDRVRPLALYDALVWETPDEINPDRDVPYTVRDSPKSPVIIWIHCCGFFFEVFVALDGLILDRFRLCRHFLKRWYGSNLKVCDKPLQLLRGFAICRHQPPLSCWIIFWWWRFFLCLAALTFTE